MVHVLHFPMTAWGKKASALCCVSTKSKALYKQTVGCQGSSGVLWRSSLCSASYNVHNWFWCVFPLLTLPVPRQPLAPEPYPIPKPS